MLYKILLFLGIVRCFSVFFGIKTRFLGTFLHFLPFVGIKTPSWDDLGPKSALDGQIGAVHIYSGTIFGVIL